MSNVNVFATQDGRPDGLSRLITYIHMIFIWIKNQEHIAEGDMGEEERGKRERGSKGSTERVKKTDRKTD